MKMSVLLFLAAATLLASAPRLYAKGVFITPGARSNAMGAAYIAVADDPTAIYWNPAGLTRLERSGAQFSLFYVNNNAVGNSSLKSAETGTVNAADGDFPLPRIYGGSPLLGALQNAEPSGFLNRDFETSAPVPFIAGYHTFDLLTIAGGIYCSGGGGGKWSDNIPSASGADRITASLDASYMFIVYNVSAAKEIMPRLSAGVGIDLVTMTDKINAQKSYLSASAVPSYRLEIDKQSSGYGVQYNGGLMYKPVDMLQLGAVIRSGTKISLHGKAYYAQQGLAALGYSDLRHTTDYDQNYTYPMTYGLGVSCTPLPKWTFAAGLDWNQYSLKRDDTSYKAPLAGTFDNANNDGNWKDSTQYRVGAEYRHTEKLSLRAGIQTDPSQLKGNNITLVNLDQYNMTYYCVGAGYRFSSASVNLTYAKGVSDKPEKAGRSYEYNINVLRAGIDYTF